MCGLHHEIITYAMYDCCLMVCGDPHILNWVDWEHHDRDLHGDEIMNPCRVFMLDGCDPQIQILRFQYNWYA